METRRVRRCISEEVHRGNKRNECVVGEIRRGRVQLIDTLLLVFNVDLFYFELGHRVNLLHVEVGGDTELVLLIVLLSFLYIERTVHDLDIHFQARRLLFEVAKRKAPMGTLDMDRIALFVEVIGQTIN